MFVARLLCPNRVYIDLHLKTWNFNFILYRTTKVRIQFYYSSIKSFIEIYMPKWIKINERMQKILWNAMLRKIYNNWLFCMIVGFNRLRLISSSYNQCILFSGRSTRIRKRKKERKSKSISLFRFICLRLFVCPFIIHFHQKCSTIELIWCIHIPRRKKNKLNLLLNHWPCWCCISSFPLNISCLLLLYRNISTTTHGNWFVSLYGSFSTESDVWSKNMN